MYLKSGLWGCQKEEQNVVAWIYMFIFGDWLLEGYWYQLLARSTVEPLLFAWNELLTHDLTKKSMNSD